MSSILSDLHVDIVRHIGSQGFRYLGPFIAAGPYYKNLVFSDVVLREADLDEYIFSSRLANEGSIYRPFLLECLKKGNEIAKYVEAVRLLAQVGPSQEAIDMLGETAPDSLYGLFAFDIFLICCGSFEQGILVTDFFLKKVPDFGEALEIADMVKKQITDMGTPGHRHFKGYKHYREIPYCRLSHCTEIDICRHCFAFSYATWFSELC